MSSSGNQARKCGVDVQSDLADRDILARPLSGDGKWNSASAADERLVSLTKRFRGYPVSPDGGLAAGVELPAIQDGADKVLDAGIVKVGMDRQMFQAVRMAQVRAIQRR